MTSWQNLFYNDRFALTHQNNPDYVKLSESMGVQAQRCVAPGDVEAKLKWLIESDGPALLDVVVDRKVWVTYSPSVHFFADFSRFPCFLWSQRVQVYMR